MRDSAHVTYRAVTVQQTRARSPEDLLELPEAFKLRKDIYKLELEARELQREIADKDRKLGSFLHNLNQRVDILTAFVANDESPQQANVIDLSPAGLSFVCNSLLAVDTPLVIKLTFPGTNLAIADFARVSYSLLSDDDNYRVGMQFTGGDIVTESLLERHIAALQAEARRRRLQQY